MTTETRQTVIAERERAFKVLANLHNDDWPIYTRTDHGTGETDYVDVYMVDEATHRINRVTYYVARACELKMSERGIRVRGGGFSKGLEIFDTLSFTMGWDRDQSNWEELR